MRRAAAPGRLPPESAGVRAVQADAGRLGAAALTPKQGPTLSEGWRRISIPRLLGECPPERPPACKPAGRSPYSASEVLS